MNNEKNDDDNEPQYVKDERAKDELFGDFMMGCPLLGSFIIIIVMYLDIVDIKPQFTINGFFTIVGCWTTGFFLYRWIIKPILKERGWYD